MSLILLKKQVNYCLLNIEDEEKKFLQQKHNRKNKYKVTEKEKKVEKNLKYFELQEKYKKVSKNVLKNIKI